MAIQYLSTSFWSLLPQGPTWFPTPGTLLDCTQILPVIIAAENEYSAGCCDGDGGLFVGPMSPAISPIY